MKKQVSTRAVIIAVVGLAVLLWSLLKPAPPLPAKASASFCRSMMSKGEAHFTPDAWASLVERCK